MPIQIRYLHLRFQLINQKVLDIHLPSKDYIYNGMSKIDISSLLNYVSKNQYNIIHLTYSFKNISYATTVIHYHRVSLNYTSKVFWLNNLQYDSSLTCDMNMVY